MNILFWIVVILVIWRSIMGFRNGLAGELIKLVSLFAALFVLAMCLMLYTSIRDGEVANSIISVFMIAVASLAFKLLSIILKSLKVIAELPIINIINKLAGILAGAAEVIVTIWILYAIFLWLSPDRLGSWMTQEITGDPVLRVIFQYDNLMKWITAV